MTRFFIDFHIHSKFSRATSRDISLESLERGAKLKGLNIIGTGDFTHPSWFEELRKNLRGVDGLFQYRDKNIFFILQAEVSNIYEQDGKSRKIHNIILAPNFDIVDQINETLRKYGNLSSDGRPIFNNLTCPELVEILTNISKEIMIIPGHCIIPGTYVLSNPNIKKIEEIKEGEKVFTHTGKLRKVEKIFKRQYKGKAYKIIPWYFANGVTTTSEHPFLTIKTDKNCSWNKGIICKPTYPHIKKCHTKRYKEYKPEWVQAGMLEKGDIILYPRIKEIKDIDFLDSKKIIKEGKRHFLIKVDENFCRLVGYYLAEGYSNSRDAIIFTFNEKEVEYIEDVNKLMKLIFNLSPKIGKTKGDIIFYSRTLRKLFEELFYCNKTKKAPYKCLPEWALYLPEDKQKEIFRGWWRGDNGSTTSRLLSNQMKIICIRLGIIPSIYIDEAESRRIKEHYSMINKRKIVANKDSIIFNNLTFFEDKFNLLSDNCFKRFVTKSSIRHGWIDEEYIYIPIRKINSFEYKGPVYNLEVENDNSFLTESAAVHNCMTPWYGIFGSKSGFDSVEECFQDQTKNIYALETGLSADPVMLWRISSLDKYSLVSNSDSHSANIIRLGREFNVFELEKPSFSEIYQTIKNKDKKKFLYTCEVPPALGKYHWDGHRNCKVFLEPKESIKYNNICPVCGKELTIGVLHRVEELADRPEGFVPDNSIPFKTLIPLSELIAVVYNTQTFSRKVWEDSMKLINEFGSELNVLLEAPEEKLRLIVNEKIVDLILNNRNGKVKVQPGYDGEYGFPLLDNSVRKSAKIQKSLTDF